MVLKKVPLKIEGKEQFFDAVISANDKFLFDEVDMVFDKMKSTDIREASCTWGPFLVVIKERARAA
jgi:hypothetical protein